MIFDPYHQWLGIPPAEQPPDYYRLLGLSQFESDPDVIDNAADQRMAHIRTVQAGEHSDDAGRLLNEVATARRALLVAAGEPIREMRVVPPPVIAEVVEEPHSYLPRRPEMLPKPPPPKTTPSPPQKHLEHTNDNSGLTWFLFFLACSWVLWVSATQ